MSGIGAAWGVAWVGMLAVLLVVFVRRLGGSDDVGRRSWRPVVIGIAIGLAVAALALLTRLG